MTTEAFTRQLLPLRDRCFRYAVSMLRNRAESEDIAQDVMLKLWDRRNALSTVGDLTGYSLRATRNAVLDRVKRSGFRSEPIEALYAQASTRPDPAQLTEQNEAMRAFLRALQHLPLVQREIIQLREVEGMNYAEIGSCLELSESQVKVYLHRGRKQLRALLDPSHNPAHSGANKPSTHG